MPASGKSDKIKGSPNQDELSGSAVSEVVDGKSGDDSVAGNGGDDWVKGGSGSDLVSFDATTYADATTLHDGGSGVDELLLMFTYDQWMRVEVQDDVARYLPWLASHLNDDGTATGHSFEFTAYDLWARKFETLRTTVDGVELNPEDEAVTLAPDSATFDEDQASYTGNVLLNDLVPDLVREVRIIDGPAQGSVEVALSGEYTYTFGDLFQDMSVGEETFISFTYQVTDADFDAEITSVSLTVTGVNDTPIAADDVATTDENAAPLVDVLANDFDIDRLDTHTVDVVTLDNDGMSNAEIPSTPAAVEIESNQIRFLPGTAYDSLAVGETALATIGYTMSDDHGAEDSATLTVTVNGVNDAPIAYADTVNITENQTLSVDVLANDTDLDASDVHSVDVVTIADDGRAPGASGTGPNVSIANNQIVISPGSGYDYLAVGESTTAILNYTMSDNHQAASSSTLTVNIAGANDAPVAVSDTGTVNEDSNVTLDVLANDYDLDVTDTLHVSAVTQPTKGKVSIAANKVLFETDGDFESLAPGQSTTSTFTYQVSDNHNATSWESTVVTVTGVNDAPIAFLDHASTTESQAVTVNVLNNDTDIDQGDALTITSAKIVSGKGVASIVNGAIRFDPNGKYENVGAGQQAEAVIEYTIKDKYGATSTSAAFVTINGEYDAPSVTESLASFGAFSLDYATPWHFERLTKMGSATGISFGSAGNATSWTNTVNLGFNNQSIFGLGQNGLSATAPTGGFEINPGRTNLIGVDLFSEEIQTGFEFSSWVDPYFKIELTPYAEIVGGVVDVDYGMSSRINSISMSNGYTKFNTSSAASSSGNSIAHDMPDSYGVGIDAYVDASLSFGLDAKGGVVGAVEEIHETATLFDGDASFDLVGAAIDTKNGELDLTVVGLTHSISNTIPLPSSVSKYVTVNIYDESNDVTVTSNSGVSTNAETTQKITGIRLDIDDILGKLPKVGTVFANLDNAKTFGVSGLASLKLDYTVLGAGFNLSLALKVDSGVTPDYTVDLLFNKPVYVEGYADPVIAIRNADWNNLPGMKSFDGSSVSVLPLFNAQLDYSSALKLGLVGDLDYKLGEINATLDIVAFDDVGITIGPLAADTVPIFNIDLATLDLIGYASTGYDQFAGNAFVLA